MNIFSSSKQSFKQVMVSALAFAVVISGVIPPPSVDAQTCSTTTTPATTYGQVTQSINVTTAGTYRVWSRIKAPDTTNNSYYFQIDNGCAVNIGDTAIPANTWTWVNYQNASSSSLVNVTLTAGAHTLTYTGKEADVQLDRVLLLSDTACVPTGTGDNCATTDAIIPTTSITAPTANTTATVGDTVTINATATDNTAVTKVEFYVDGALKSTDTASPYSYAWPTTGIAAGAHSLSVRAYDAAGNTATSTTVNITLNPSNVVLGDANNDLRVNAIDLSILITRDGQNFAAADFNKDGTVGAADMAILLSKWTW
jgi:hypothetical protein